MGDRKMNVLRAVAGKEAACMMNCTEKSLLWITIRWNVREGSVAIFGKIVALTISLEARYFTQGWRLVGGRTLLTFEDV